jgi:ornithine cyclodeaminase/alanine dehydrogenase
MSDAIAVVERAFRALGEGRAVNQPRRRLVLANLVLHLMDAAWPEEGVLGFKAYTAGRAGAHFFVHLFRVEDGEPLAIMEADWLGRVRTGAASGVATKYLARPDASTVGVLGAGGQARTQLMAVCAVRPVREARVYSRTPERRERYAAEMAELLGIAVHPVDDARSAVEGVDIVVTATTAREPVLLGSWLRPGVHVNAIGVNWPNRREIDAETVRRADVVVVDSVEQARLESGDLLPVVEGGELRWDAVRELGAVVAGLAPGRPRPEAITLFESHGIALEDVAAAALVERRARGGGLGQRL